MAPRKRSKDIFARIFRESKRLERRALIAWIRFAKKHRHSNILPFVLFALLFVDGFIFILPSTLILVAAVTISPKRWLFFAFIFLIAVSLNNAMTYYIGRSIPISEILYWIKFASVENFWESAQEAIRDYGKYATFIGGLIGLPTQMILMIIGTADRQAMGSELVFKTSMEAALVFGAIGHGIKVFVLCGLVRYGWVKLERKVEKSEAVTTSN